MLRISCVLCLIAVIVGCRDYQSPTAAIQGSVISDPSQIPYEAIDLGTAGGIRSFPIDVNDPGQVIGWSLDSAGAFHAFLWQDGVVHDLGTLGGATAVPSDINNAGQVVGTSTTASGVRHPFLWSDGVMQDLDPDGQCRCGAVRLNNAGHVILNGSDGLGHGKAFVWRDGVLTALATLGGPPALLRGDLALDINEHDQIVGTSNAHPVLWEDGTIRDLGVLYVPPGVSSAIGINNRGQVLGSYRKLGRLPRAFFWERGRMSDLGPLPGQQESNAIAINERGQVLGQSARLAVTETWQPFLQERDTLVPLSPTYQTDPSRRVVALNNRGVVLGKDAWVWEDGVMWELPSVMGTGQEATAINTSGDVVGWAYDASFHTHAVLWRRISALAAAPAP